MTLVEAMRVTQFSRRPAPVRPSTADTLAQARASSAARVYQWPPQTTYHTRFACKFYRQNE